jgi:hypothetical protein
MSGPGSGAETPKDDGASVSPSNMVKKRFHNGWTKEIEDLMADWADKAACYRWMHEKTSRLYSGYDKALIFPVIILSTITGTANFALDSFLGDMPEIKKYAQGGIGGLSILAGIITTIANKLAYSKDAEAHRVAGTSWGKFNRLLCIEMSIHPDERMDAFNFLKMFRIELDRLIEQSPPIPEGTINEFNKLFKDADVVKPEITGILQHTKVYKDHTSRLKRIAAEATIALHYKRGVIKQMVMDDFENKTRKVAIEVARETAREILEQQAAVGAAKATGANVTKNRKASIHELRKDELSKELKEIAARKAGSVAALRNKFGQSSKSLKTTIDESIYSNSELEGIDAEDKTNEPNISEQTHDDSVIISIKK